VILSTLHQSSLGTLYLIVPGKLHPLWYTPMLPVLFWISAVAVGFAMVIVESRLSAKAFKRHLEMPLLSDIGRILVAILSVYGIVRIWDLVSRGVLGEAFSGSYEGNMFLLEMVLGLIAPIALLSIPRVRRNSRGLYIGAGLAVLGFVTHRLNVSITGFDGAQGGHYMPSWAEGAISLMMVAVGFGAFAFAVKYLNVFPAEGEGGHEHREVHAKPTVEAVAAPVFATLPESRSGNGHVTRPRF
jgi:Ni/Fe-hydrogenase subunit HybB-like protein